MFQRLQSLVVELAVRWILPLIPSIGLGRQTTTDIYILLDAKVECHIYYIYHQFIVRFSMALEFLLIKFFLQEC